MQVRRRAHEARADVNNSIQHRSVVHFHTITKDVKESASKVSEETHISYTIDYTFGNGKEGLAMELRQS